MKFTVSTPSGTRKAVALTFEAADVDAAIENAIAERRRTLALPGFRKGKVPAGIIEKRFGDEVYPAATQQAIDKALETVMEAEKLQPLSAVDLDNPTGLFKRGEGYECVLSFDVLPEIELPEYKGIAIEQPKPVLDDKEVEAFLERMREEAAEFAPLTIARMPQDGDQANVNYEGFNEQGEPLLDVKGTIDVALGKGQVIPDFEALIKTILPGESKQGPVTFPADYAHKELAGKTVTMKVKVNNLRERKEAELDDNFARKVGAESLEKLREMLPEHLMNGKKQSARNVGMQNLLGKLQQAAPAFDLPGGMIESRIRQAKAEYMSNMQRGGQSFDEEALKKFEENIRTAIENELRPQVLLMVMARKEGIEVTSQEVEMQIYSAAMRAGQDYRKMSEAYRRAGLTNDIYDRLLAEKALKLAYDAAVVTEVEAKPDEAKAE